MRLIEHFVGGKIIPGKSDRKSKIFNPATGEQESEVRLASKSDFEANLTSDSCSPVAGLKTFPFFSEVPETIFPPTKCSINFMDTVF